MLLYRAHKLLHVQLLTLTSPKYATKAATGAANANASRCFFAVSRS